METFKDYYRLVPISLKGIVEELRAIILKASDELVEEIKWRSPIYSINQNICSIISHRTHVNLQFFNGADLDSEDVLEGTGRDMRHIKIKRISDINEELLLGLIRKAIDHDKTLKKQ